MSPGGANVEGVVLCLAGGHRLAALAREVVAIEAPDGEAPWAGVGFDSTATPAAEGRLLRHATGGLVVDSLEVHGEPLALLPVPPALADARATLLGFVEAAGHLWPVVSLPALAGRLGRVAS